jgi:hypothetical protein
MNENAMFIGVTAPSRLEALNLGCAARKRGRAG